MAPERYSQKPYEPPAGATQILLVRHGASADFVVGEPFPTNQDGQGDPPLSPIGWKQALALSERLSAEAVDAIYVSNLIRTHETAAPLAGKLDMEAIAVRDLREVYLGDWDGGLFRQKVREPDNPIVAEFLRTRRWDVVPGAENDDAFQQRCVRALAEIANCHPGERVVAVAHGGVIGAILAHTTGAPIWAFAGAENTSVNHLVVHEGTTSMRSFNDTAHLGGCFA